MTCRREAPTARSRASFAAKIPPVAAMRDDVAMPQRSLRIRGTRITLE
ncbi:MAG: hypothetical protein ACJ72W_08625 [Actinoallomurus sp.]